MSAIDKKLSESPIWGHVITLTICITGVIIAFALNKGDFDERELRKEVKEKASINYVDEKHKQAIKYTDEKVTDHEKAAKVYQKSVQEQLNSMNRKLDILIEKAIPNK